MKQFKVKENRTIKRNFTVNKKLGLLIPLDHLTWKPKVSRVFRSMTVPRGSKKVLGINVGFEPGSSGGESEPHPSKMIDKSYFYPDFQIE